LGGATCPFDFGVTMNWVDIPQQVVTMWHRLKPHHFVAVAMILTGILYPFHSEYVIPHALLQILGASGFLVWSFLCILGGVGILIKPVYMLAWMTPLLIFLVATAWLALQGVTITAVIYYAPLYLFSVYGYFVGQGQRWGIFRHVRPTQVAGVLHFLMAMVILLRPYGAGMELLYDAIGVFLVAVDPVLFYFLMYLCTGIILLFPTAYSRYVLQILSLPFFIHTVVFAMVSVFEYQAFALTPFMVACGLTWLWFGGGHGT